MIIYILKRCNILNKKQLGIYFATSRQIKTCFQQRHWGYKLRNTNMNIVALKYT